MCYGNILEDSMRKARRSHRCDECGRVIQPSEVYHRQAEVQDEFVFALKNCARCHVYWLAWYDIGEDDGDGCYSVGSVRAQLSDAVACVGVGLMKAALRKARQEAANLRKG